MRYLILLSFFSLNACLYTPHTVINPVNTQSNNNNSKVTVGGSGADTKTHVSEDSHSSGTFPVNPFDTSVPTGSDSQEREDPI